MMEPEVQHPRRTRLKGAPYLQEKLSLTLLVVRDFQSSQARLPGARELAELLEIQPTTAAMRLKRLGDLGYLVDTEGSWGLREDLIRDPEPAALLLKLQSRGGRLREKEFFALIDEDKHLDFNNDEEAPQRLVQWLADARYLRKAMGWAGNQLELGPQFAREQAYLRLLAKQLDDSTSH